MTRKMLAVVLGATRGQGGSVVNALLKTGQYSIRGVTHDANTPEARRLQERGVEVVAADLDDPSSLDAAFASAHVIFAVTTMYDGDVEREVAQGKKVADSAAAVDMLQHFIWSTLPSASAISDGKIPVPHMDGKAQVDEYILNALPALAQKTTFYWGGFYAENVTYPPYAPNCLSSAGNYVWVQPVASDTLVPMVGDHNVNTGIFIRAILEKAHLCLPRGYVLGVADWVVHGDMLEAWATILSEKNGETMDVVYVHSDVETVGQIWPGTGRELGQMLKLSEKLGRDAWTKKDTTALTMQDLGLEVGDRDGKLGKGFEYVQMLR
ncbi:NAD(P)-binding protein [Decorospora gaudefroyi]|uniref:NAD(P)-binding protein n=1 Tax=Decorospora gaudefroyi TaxID=184978 RepID=A0A6A5KC54_9PLEO|nr:NAD(P)-binding protein [Decorospora gaudefroyi]